MRSLRECNYKDMTLTKEQKEIINEAIYALAYEIEKKLASDGDFFLADMACVKPSEVGEVALKTAIRYFKNEMSKNNTK